MCGIAGGWNVDVEAVKVMLRTTFHRGPDSSGVFQAGPVCLGANRLRLYGGPVGEQPMCAGEQALVFNGEIYNYREWVSPDPGSDTHALLSYLSAGRSPCALNGQFAFGFWDGRRLILGRDYPGIVPLFFARDAGQLAFASERAALHAIGFTRTTPLRPGTCLMFDGQNVREECWWQHEDLKVSDGDPVDVFDQLINNAVALRVRHRDADVNVGVMLSGGVDSSLITALAAQAGPVHAFIFDGADTRAALRVCEVLNLPYTLVRVTREEIAQAATLLDRELENGGFDNLVRALFAVSYLLARQAASEGIRILLSGEGSDELFAGYELYDQCAGRINAVTAEVVKQMHAFSLERLDLSVMLNAIESRPPYLDPRVLKFALSVPEGYKRRDSREKWIVRRVAERYLPADIAWGPKSPLQVSTGSFEALYGQPWRPIV